MNSPLSKCDACFAPTESASLTELHDDYREGVLLRWVCPECIEAMNNALASIDRAINKERKLRRQAAVRKAAATRHATRLGKTTNARA